MTRMRRLWVAGAGAAVLGSLSGIGFALSGTEDGPSGEIPPLFGPDNPAPSSPVSYEQMSAELAARSYDLDQILARIAKQPANCAAECKHDNSPKALSHLLRSACELVDASEGAATYPEVQDEFKQLADSASSVCEQASGMEAARPVDPADASWAGFAQSKREQLTADVDRALEVLRTRQTAQPGEDHR